MAMIRMADPARDAEELAAIYAPYVERTCISFELEPPGVAEMARRIAATRAPWLVCERDGRIEGYAYGGPHRDRAAYRWSADASVYVREGRHRRGIGRALYTALFPLLRAQGFHAVHAGITLPNAASVAIHESFGFRPIGVYPAVGFKLGAWHDVGWWQLVLRERVGTPAPLLDLAALRCAPEWDEALAAGAAALGDR